MKKLLLILSLALCSTAFAQKYKKLSEIKVEDFAGDKSTIDPDAPAEILYRTMHYTVETNGTINTKYVERIRIFNKDKAEDYLNPEITLYDIRNEKQSLSGPVAYTYNLEGGKVVSEKVLKDSKFKSKEDKTATVTKFTFPNVKNGSIIEYSYEISSPPSYLMMMPTFVIEKDIPTKYVDYFLDAPKTLGYSLNYKGDAAPSQREVENKVMYGTDYFVYRFAYENVPSFKEEDFVLNNNNFRTAIKAELNSTNFNGEFKSYSLNWNDINKRLKDYEDFGSQINKKSLVKDLLPADIKLIGDKLARADAVLKFVQKNYSWNNEVSVFTDKGIRNLLTTKVGNSAEMNLLLLMLMREAGLEANPVVSSTVDRGQLLGYNPTITQLNYVFPALEEKGIYHYYDGTSKFSDVYELPRRALNGNGILLLEKEAKIVNVFYPHVSKTYLTVDANLNKDGTFSGTFKDRDTDLYANFVNEEYLENKDEYAKLYKDRYTFPFSDLKSGLEDNGDFETSFSFNSDTFVDAIGKKLIFNPLLFLYSQNHSFNQTTPRKSPLEFFTASQKIKKVTITLPEGYVFENVPQSKKFRTEDNAIEYIYFVEQKGNKLTVETTTKIDDSSFPKEYYPAFKQIFDNITKLEGQVVTAVKK